MQNEVKKDNKISWWSDIFINEKRIKWYKCSYKRDSELSTITIIDYNSAYPDDEISSLNDVLNIQRQCEVEEFYWELMGDDSHEDELFLVGSMVDKATVNKIDKDLHIVMYRCLTKCKK